MRKAAIITIPLQYLLSNYGTFFQHYALREVLKRMGVSSVRLPYTGEPFSAVKWLYLSLRRFIGNSIRRIRGMELVRLDVPCGRFERDYKSLIGPLRESCSGEEDVAIVGSDQIWQSVSPTAWLREFPTSKRISYAASSDWNLCMGKKAWREGVMRHYPTMTAISVREEAGVNVFETMGLNNPKAVCVCDPTSLLQKSDYLGIADHHKAFEAPTLLCYFVNERLPVLKVERLAEELNVQLRILGIQGAEKAVPSKYLLRLTPRQFLSAMRDAKYLVTNSYHGLLFSLYFEKEFLFVQQSSRSVKSQNVRQHEILTRYGLTDRELSVESEVEECADLLRKKVNWKDVSSRMMLFRRFSYEWLEDQICGRDVNAR